MKYLNQILIIGFLSYLFSCGSSSSDEYLDNELLSDGTHCAEITYTNPNTGTTNTYTLHVDVFNGELERIHWPNGGWLDEDHFAPPTFDDDGYTSFTSDKGYEYTVKLLAVDCDLDTDLKIKFNDCCEDLELSADERYEVCANFHISLHETMNAEQCKIIHQYVSRLREFNDVRKNITTDENQVYFKLENPGEIVFNRYNPNITAPQQQLLIAKKNEVYYLLSVVDKRVCPHGLIEFDPKNNAIQDVRIMKSHYQDYVEVFRAKILDSGGTYSEYENYIRSN